jgi:hypothetical protein
LRSAAFDPLDDLIICHRMRGWRDVTRIGFRHADDARIAVVNHALRARWHGKQQCGESYDATAHDEPQRDLARKI